jgi:carboxypeptidase T
MWNASRAKRWSLVVLPVLAFFSSGLLARAVPEEPDTRRFVQVAASTKEERSTLADLGMSIEAVRSDSVWGIITPEELVDVRHHAFKILGDFDISVARGGHEVSFDFPARDERYHNNDETLAMLKDLNARNPDITRIVSIGKSTEGRDLWAFHINTSPDALTTGRSGKPGAIFLGTHHAREHLSTEIPLMLAEYLLKWRADPEISKLLDSRDLWIVPIVNPDGKEYDIASGRYRAWRKNRSHNSNGSYGVDLNRNYGYGWGTGGSSKYPSSDIYMGPKPFSEPETRAVRDFVRSLPNDKVLLSFHTYSELILYPWGNTYRPIANARDRDAFKTIARTMAGWNHYTAEPTSGLYITSGDTVDWAYGELGIFAFTFELSPRSSAAGGFYPGPGIIDRVFQENLKPCLYLIGLANDPYQVLGKQSAYKSSTIGSTTGFLPMF